MQSITVPLSNPVAAGATFTANYPTGKARKDYIQSGAILVVGQSTYTSPTVSLGASSITITNPTGRAIAAGTRVILSLNSPAENAGSASLGALARYAGHIEYPGSPVGNLTPDFVGQRCFDTTNKIVFMATGLTSSDWYPLLFGTVSGSLLSGIRLLDGTTMPFSGILGQQNTAVDSPADTAENTMYSLAIPANTLGINDCLRVTHSWTCTNNANTKSLQFKFGSTLVSNTNALGSTAGGRGIFHIRNRASRSANVADASVGFGIGGGGSVPAITTIDFGASQTFNVTMTKATAGDTVRLEAIMVELLRGA